MNFVQNFLKTFLLVTFLLISSLIKVFANDPVTFVQGTVDSASEILNSSASIKEKKEKLKLIAKNTVDIKGIGFYTLGSHRKNLSSDEKDKYSVLFEKYFLKTFSSRLAEYTDPKIEVIGKEKVSDNYTIVSSKLIATKDRPEIKIDWRIYTKDPNNILIRDLIIEGLSLARTQKEEFNSIIQSNEGNINSLFANLENFINK